MRETDANPWQSRADSAAGGDPGRLFRIVTAAMPERGAHFDLHGSRPARFGAPFDQVLAFCREQQQRVTYAAFGTSRRGTVAGLFRSARDLGARFDDDVDMQEAHLIERRAERDRLAGSADDVCLTIDVDGLPAAAAPRVPAPNPFGVAGCGRNLHSSHQAVGGVAPGRRGGDEPGPRRGSARGARGGAIDPAPAGAVTTRKSQPAGADMPAKETTRWQTPAPNAYASRTFARATATMRS